MVSDDDSKINLHEYDPPEDGFYHVYGDGSWTAPEKWWASLGGFGLWIPQHPDTGKVHIAAGGAVGQDGSSTRQELAGWLAALTQPFKVCYATEGAALIAKTKKLLVAAANYENLQKLNSTITAFRNPFGRRWSLQPDGDMWELAWNAIIRRGSTSQKIRKVKSHATLLDVAGGRSTTFVTR